MRALDLLAGGHAMHALRLTCHVPDGQMFVNISNLQDNVQ